MLLLVETTGNDCCEVSGLNDLEIKVTDKDMRLTNPRSNMCGDIPVATIEDGTLFTQRRILNADTCRFRFTIQIQSGNRTTHRLTDIQCID